MLGKGTVVFPFKKQCQWLIKNINRNLSRPWSLKVEFHQGLQVSELWQILKAVIQFVPTLLASFRRLYLALSHVCQSVSSPRSPSAVAWQSCLWFLVKGREDSVMMHESTQKHSINVSNVANQHSQNMLNVNISKVHWLSAFLKKSFISGLQKSTMTFETMWNDWLGLGNKTTFRSNSQDLLHYTLIKYMQVKKISFVDLDNPFKLQA